MDGGRPGTVGPGAHLDELSIDAPGADEVPVMPWSLLFRQRMADRAKQSPRYPWLVLTTVLLGLFSVGFTITILSVSIPRIADDLGVTARTDAIKTIREAQWLRVAGEIDDGEGSTMLLASGTLHDFVACYGRTSRTEHGELLVDAAAMELLGVERGDRVLAVDR